MAKGSGQKLKLLLLLKLLEEKTDEAHAITTEQIQEALEEQGISCDRKTLYSDIQTLIDMDYDIQKENNRNGGGWKLMSRDFELAELKLLVDAVQSSKFISAKKSKELIDKIGALTSENNRRQLNRQVYVLSRVKSDNETVLYSIDAIHYAIMEGKQIEFTYMDWTEKKILEPRSDKRRVVSPWALIWQNENYYLLAFDEAASKMKHYRVDKMASVDMLPELRKGSEAYHALDLGKYTNENFGMFGGEESVVELEFVRGLMGVMVDRFGKEISLISTGDGTFKTRVKVFVSGQFFGWLAGLGNGVIIKGPKDISTRYEEYVQNIVDAQNNGKVGY